MATKVKLIDNTISPTLAGGTFTGHIHLGDSDQVRWGGGNDGTIHHDGSHFRLRAGTGNFNIQTDDFHLTDSNNTLVRFRVDADGPTRLYHNGNQKLETSSAGATVSGTLTVTGDLDITGNVNSASVTDLDVTDKTITLGAGQTEGLSGGSGIVIDGSGASILWDETNNEWDFNADVKTTGSLKGTTLRLDDGNSLVGGIFSEKVITGSGTSNDISIFAESISNGGEIHFMTNGSVTKRLTIDTSGNVGIGVSSIPSWANLITDGTVAVGGVLYIKDSQKIQGLSGFPGGASNLILNPDGGNVGIGTTSPGADLHIGGPEATPGGAAGTVDRLYIQPYSNTGGPYKFTARTVSGSSDFLDMYYGSNHIISYGLDGKVGIGTTSPTMPLSVQAASNAYAISMHGRSDGYSELYGASNDGSTKYSFLQSHSAQTKLYTLVNTPLLFGTNSTERMRINSSGNVVINKDGFSSLPTGSKLNVFGDGEVFRIDGSGATSRTIRFRNVGTNGSSNGIIMSDGTLQLKNEDANAAIYLNSVRDIEFQTTSGNGTAGHMRFYSYNTQIMHIDGANNRVGIGTASPSSLLELQKTTAGSITGGTGNKGAVLTLHHEAQWESAYGSGGSTPDWLGAIDFSTGDTSTGEGIRASIRATVNNYYNTNDLVFYTANQGDTTLDERMRIKDDGSVTVPGTLHSPGHVIQTVYNQTASVVTPSQTQNDYITLIQVNITPKYATSKILISGIAAVNLSGGNYPAIHARIYRDGTNIKQYQYWGYEGATNTHRILNEPVHYLDSPTTTSALTYYVKIANTSGSAYTGTYTARGNQYNASTITVQEIAQ